MYFNNILYSMIVICSIGFVQKQVFASSLYFTAPPQGFGLSENNIGGYNAALDNWGPISTDPSLVHDIYNATDPTKKYLLKIGRFRYQELYQGSWYQYRVPSLQRQLDECKTMPQPKGACTPLLTDKSCGVESLLVTNYWDSQDCGFIDIDEDISRDIFAAYMDGRIATGINFDALEIEVTDDTLRN